MGICRCNTLIYNIKYTYKYCEGITILVDGMAHILKNYTKVSNNEPLAQNPLANFIRTELPSQFKKEIPNSGKYFIKGSSGMGSWATIPWIGFLNRDISSTFKEGYYVAYIFKEDMSGFYLSLMFGVGNFRNFSREELLKISESLRSFIQACFPKIKFHSPMKLLRRYSKSNIASRYEEAGIYNIEYKKDNLPSEKELINDLKLLLEIYDVFHENNFIESLTQTNDNLSNSDNVYMDANNINMDLNKKSMLSTKSNVNNIKSTDMDKNSKFINQIQKMLVGIEDELNDEMKDTDKIIRQINEKSLDFKSTKPNIIQTNEVKNKSVRSNSESMQIKYPHITIANSNTFYRPVLELFKDGKNHRNAEIIGEIRKILPDDEKYSDKVETWVTFPIKHFRDAGCLVKINRGLHRITDDGLKLLELDIDSLDRKVLTRYCPKYREKYLNQSDDENNAGDYPNKNPSENSKVGPKSKIYSNSDEIFWSLLELFKDGNIHSNDEIAEAIRIILPIDEKYNPNVNRKASYCINHFFYAGCLERIKPRFHRITYDGMKLLEKDIVINQDVLLQYCPKYKKKISPDNKLHRINPSTDNDHDKRDDVISKNHSSDKRESIRNLDENNLGNFRSESLPNDYSYISISDPNSFYRPVLELFRDEGIHNYGEIVDEIRKILPYNEKNLDAVKHRVSVSIRFFREAGCLEGIGQELSYITDDGLKLLELDIDRLDRKVLLEYCPKYQEKYLRDNKFDIKNQTEKNDNIENKAFDKKFEIKSSKTNKIKISEIESRPNKYYNFKRHSNKYKKLAELLSDENIEKLDDISYLEEDEFNYIIENLITVHKKVLDELLNENNIVFEKLEILEKMFLFSKAFVKTHYKSTSDLGYYRFNEICIDEREPTNYKKIRTIIHELSHFLFSEILEQVLSLTLNTDKTDVLEAFVFYTLTDVNDFYLMDEYCACTVEGRFVSRGHQDYTSFKNSLEKEHTYSDEDISVYGNTFAKYIILIMESFITENLIEEIRKEGLNINYPHNDIKFETDEYLEWDDFKDTIELMLKNKANYDKIEAETIFEYSLEIKKNNS